MIQILSQYFGIFNTEYGTNMQDAFYGSWSYILFYSYFGYKTLCRYLTIIKKEGFEISQPALDPNKSEVHHPITARRQRSMVHRWVTCWSICTSNSILCCFYEFKILCQIITYPVYVEL